MTQTDDQRKMKLRRCRPEVKSKGQSVSAARKWFLVCSFAALCLPILEASIIAAELPDVSCSPLLAANGIYHPWQSSYPVSSWHSQELEYADCRPQKMLYEVGAVRLTDPKARSKIKKSLLSIIRELALLLCYGMSFVYCTLSMTVFCTNISSEFVRDTKTFQFQSFNEVKKELIVTVLFLLIVLQYYWIDCALQGAHTCTRSYKYCITVYDHHVSKAITKCPLSVLSLRLLLSGDVETNPGPPIYGHRRTKSLDIFLKCSRESNCIFIQEFDRVPDIQLSVDRQHLLSRVIYIHCEVKKCIERGRLILDQTCIVEFKQIHNTTTIAVNNFVIILSALFRLREMLFKKPDVNALLETSNIKKIKLLVENEYDCYMSFEKTVREQSKKLRGTIKNKLVLSGSAPPTLNDAIDHSSFCNAVKKFLNIRYELDAAFTKESYRIVLLDILDKNYKLHPGENKNLNRRDYTHLLLILNQLYIHTTLGKSEDSKEKIPCAFCYSKRPINSHIWSLALLKAFRKIHGDDTSDQFLLFLDRDAADADQHVKNIGQNNIAIHMLCKDCDQGTWASGMENKLSQLYPFVSAYPHNKLKFDNSQNWLQRILAVIMARGILMKCNLLRETQSSFKMFLNLIKFAKSSFDFPVPEIYVFLLPNSIYFDDLEIFPSFERQLRYPTFPSICDLHEIGEEGTFYYMQFDCMHVVYPIDKSSTEYFQDYQKNCSPNHFPPTVVRKEAFPPALLAINFVRSMKTVTAMMKLKCESELQQYTRMMAVLRHNPESIQFQTQLSKVKVPQYTKDSSDTQDKGIISYTPTKKDYILRAKSGSILRYITTYCRLKPNQLIYTLQTQGKKRKVIDQLYQLVKSIDDVRQRLYSANAKECERISASISQCENVLRGILTPNSAS